MVLPQLPTLNHPTLNNLHTFNSQLRPDFLFTKRPKRTPKREKVEITELHDLRPPA